jgi:predicted porin
MNKKLVTLAVAAALAAPTAVMAEATLYGKLHQSIDYIDQKDISEVLVVPVPQVDTDGNPVVDSDGIPVTMDETFFLRGKGFNGWTVSRADGNLPQDQTIVVTDSDGNLVSAGTIADLPALNELVNRLAIDNGPVGPSNRLGVKGSEDLGGGLKAIYQVEFGVRLADGDFNAANGDRGSVSMRNTFVGLAGGWGTFLVGRHDTPLKISTGKLDLFADTVADYNGPLGFNDIRADNAIAYISPSFSGFQLAGAMHAGGGATVGQGYNVDADSISQAWSVAGIYSNGPFYASAAYETLGKDMGGVSASTLGGFDDFNKWRVGLGLLDWNGFTLAGVYENRSNVGFLSDQDASSWEILAGYSFGNNMIKASYGQLDRDLSSRRFRELGDLGRDLKNALDGDLDNWTVAFDHNFSKRTRAYVLYTDVSDDSATDWNSFSLGLIHSF